MQVQGHVLQRVQGAREAELRVELAPHLHHAHVLQRRGIVVVHNHVFQRWQAYRSLHSHTPTLQHQRVRVLHGPVVVEHHVLLVHPPGVLAEQDAVETLHVYSSRPAATTTAQHQLPSVGEGVTPEQQDAQAGKFFASLHLITPTRQTELLRRRKTPQSVFRGLQAAHKQPLQVRQVADGQVVEEHEAAVADQNRVELRAVVEGGLRALTRPEGGSLDGEAIERRQLGEVHRRHVDAAKGPDGEELQIGVSAQCEAGERGAVQRGVRDHHTLRRLADGAARRRGDGVGRGSGVWAEEESHVPVRVTLHVGLLEAEEGLGSEDVELAGAELGAFCASVSQLGGTGDGEGEEGRERKRVDVVSEVNQTE